MKKNPVINLIWFTNPQSPALPLELIRSFIQPNARIILWTTATLAITIKSTLSDYLCLHNSSIPTHSLRVLPWEDYLHAPQYRAISNNIQTALQRHDWTAASDLLRIVLLEQSNEPAIYMDIKIKPKANAIAHLATLLSTLNCHYNANTQMKPNCLVGGRNNLHCSDGSRISRKLFAVARLVNEYLEAILSDIKINGIRPHLLSTFTTGNAVAFALNAYTDQASRLRYMSHRLDENRFFDQPTGGHVSMTPRQLRQGSAQIESILRRSQAIQYAQSQSTATDELMCNVMQVRLCVLKAPTSTSLIRGSIYGRKNCFFGPFRDKYIPSDYKLLHPTFLNDAINLPSSAECKH